MITLIHGDDSEKIETSLISIISKTKPIRIDGVKIKLKELEEQILGGSLFGEESIFIIENIFKNKNKKELLNLIKENSDNFFGVFVERGKVNKRDLLNIKFDSIVEHLLPQYYFKFLDDFYPKNGKILANLYNELLKTMTAEQIYYSLVKRIRGLIAVKLGMTNHSEIARFAPWQLGKLKQQAQMWTEEELVIFYKKLFEIEVKMKTSALPVTVEKYLDMMIRTELN